MVTKDHRLTNSLVAAALERYVAEPRVLVDGDTVLIVMGTLLEEMILVRRAIEHNGRNMSTDGFDVKKMGFAFLAAGILVGGSLELIRILF